MATSVCVGCSVLGCSSRKLLEPRVVQWGHGDNQLRSLSVSHVLRNCV